MHRHTRHATVLTALTALLLTVFTTAPAAAAGDSARLGHTNHGHHYGQLPPPTPPPAGAHVILVDPAAAGTLPVGTSDAAWSGAASNVNLTVAAGCSGPGCIHVQLVGVTACGTSTAIVGCAVGNPDGSCIAQVVNWLHVHYADVERAVLEHETGHCLGLPHNTTDPNSIMQPAIDISNPAPGPDNQDLADVHALYP